MNRQELLDKYSTGHRYISPAAEYYPGGWPPDRYWCEADIDELEIEYARHLLEVPTERCHSIKISNTSIYAPLDHTEEEFDWANIEYKLRMAIPGRGRELDPRKKVRFVV